MISALSAAPEECRASAIAEHHETQGVLAERGSQRREEVNGHRGSDKARLGSASAARRSTRIQTVVEAAHANWRTTATQRMDRRLSGLYQNIRCTELEAENVLLGIDARESLLLGSAGKALHLRCP